MGKSLSFFTSIMLIFGLVFALSCTTNVKKQEQTSTLGTDTSKGLKDYYKDYFPIGYAIDTKQLEDSSSRFLKKNFSLLSTVIAMKLRFIHPHEDYYYWEKADSLVNFAMQNGMKIRGHTLVWVNTPTWVLRDTVGLKLSKEEMLKRFEQNPCDCACPTVTRTVLLKRLKEHIHAVVGRYKGKVYAWDVVNEAVYDNNREYLKSNDWKKIIGEDYIDSAFTYAHQADPNALLFLNDYDSDDPRKTDRICRLIKSLQQKKIPIHGVGIQGHWTLEKPSIEHIENEIKAYVKLGMKVEITELDIPIYDTDAKAIAGKYVHNKDLNQLMLKQAARYKEVFELFRKYKNNISGVTFWLSLMPNMQNGLPSVFDSNFNANKFMEGLINF
jgi:endo-1,4-beta-xylanase